jgi:hypothetical protein
MTGARRDDWDAMLLLYPFIASAGKRAKLIYVIYLVAVLRFGLGILGISARSRLFMACFRR